MDVNDLWLLADDVIVDRAHPDALMSQLGEDGAQFRGCENEVSHHRRVVGLSAEPSPGTEHESRRDRDVTDPDRKIAAGKVVANIARGTRSSRAENAADRIPDSGGRLLSEQRAGSGTDERQEQGSHQDLLHGRTPLLVND